MSIHLPSPGLLAAWPLPCALAPAALMAFAAVAATRSNRAPDILWSRYRRLAQAALLCTLASLAACLPGADGAAAGGLRSLSLALTLPGALTAVLVQFLGVVIGAFSARYLQGEAGQDRYVAALAATLASVQLLLVADHWALLVACWAATGLWLHRLLCFYPDRPFAQLAAHKKHMADRLSDALLVAAAACAWWQTGSGSLSDLAARLHDLPAGGASPALQASALCLVLAVMLRTAILPAHGWLIQVMEAPTPVSALMHAGVVNLGGFVLVRFAPLLAAVPAARWALAIGGLCTAVLAGLVMTTRISIKVRLAWSTAAQMGFMLLECALGLYSMALLHLLGHSLYKSHAFLSSSTVVRETAARPSGAAPRATGASMIAAPVATGALVLAVQALAGRAAWPWWWTGVLALAWAPLLWMPAQGGRAQPARLLHVAIGAAQAGALTACLMLAQAWGLGVADTPDDRIGPVALAGLCVLYAAQVLLQRRPARVPGWRRRTYAGYYLDQPFTRAALPGWLAGRPPAPEGGQAGGAFLPLPLPGQASRP